MKFHLGAGILSGMVLLASVSVANAGIIELQVTSGGATQTVNSIFSGTSANLSAANTINSVAYSATASISDISGALQLNLDASGANAENSARTVTYALTITDLTAPLSSADFAALFSGINPLKNTQTNHTLTASEMQVYYDTNNVAFGTANLVYDSGLTGLPNGVCESGANYSCSDSGIFSINASPFSLTEILTVNYSGGSSGALATASSSFTSTPVTAVPEPASLVILGSGLFMAGWTFRRRTSRAA